jgi:CHAT domain-containing protein
MDRVISSYTPTVRALRYAREQASRQADPSCASTRALIVAMPTTPGLAGHGRLTFVDRELTALRTHLPNHVLLQEPDPTEGLPELSPNTPTKARVMDHLSECPIAHFACHGDSHPTDPSRSLLLLHDHTDAPLTVASLAPVQLDRAQLAYLSACRTASIDAAKLIDEAIHLTTAFQLAGFPHVIGTLWEINDQIAAAVADAFYAHLRIEGNTVDTSRAAYALHTAVRAVRDAKPRTPSLWGAYLHAGA